MTVECGYCDTENGAENEEGGVRDEQECLAGMKGGDDDAQEGPELLPGRGGVLGLFIVVQREESGVGGKVVL